MRPAGARAVRATICVLLLGASLPFPGASDGVHAQSTPEVGPPLEEAQAVWSGFWTAVIIGDLSDARTHVHSQRQHLFPGRHTPEELQHMASQMVHCRLDPNPLLADLDEIIYRVRCEHRGHTVESQVGLRRDRDGSWRLSAL